MRSGIKYINSGHISYKSGQQTVQTVMGGVDDKHGIWTRIWTQKTNKRDDDEWEIGVLV